MNLTLCLSSLCFNIITFESGLRIELKMNESKLMRKRIFNLALPNIISNITVPLLSLVDVALAGHLGSPTAIGAVAVASGLVSYIYWLFAFLRMGTTGFTSQAYGRSDVEEICRQLAKGLFYAGILSLLIIFLRKPLYQFAFLLSANGEALGNDAQLYLSYAFFGAPAALGLYTMNGWFIGMQNTRIPMVISILQNVINIVFSFYLVQYQGLGIAGLAIGTITAQYTCFILMLLLAVRRYKRYLRFIKWSHCTDTKGIGRYFTVGGLLMIRTTLMGAVTLFFTYASAKIGTNTVAANTLLMQLFTLFSYFMDGFAYAGEALCGRYIGERNRKLGALMRKELLVISGTITLLITLIYLVLPKQILGILTNDPVVIDVAMNNVYWVALIPIVSFAAFIWDGLLVGATASRVMLETIFVGAILYFSTYFIASPSLGSGGLWLAFDLYLFGRSVYGLLAMKRIDW